MPMIRITLAEGRTAEQKKKAAQEMTETMVRHCNAHPEHVYVVFDDISADDWTVGGVTIRERKARRGEA